MVPITGIDPPEPPEPDELEGISLGALADQMSQLVQQEPNLVAP